MLRLLSKCSNRRDKNPVFYLLRQTSKALDVRKSTEYEIPNLRSASDTQVETGGRRHAMCEPELLARPVCNGSVSQYPIKST
jgi:hypothetical protein